jgi:hypothetical protein
VISISFYPSSLSSRRCITHHKRNGREIKICTEDAIGKWPIKYFKMYFLYFTVMRHIRHAKIKQNELLQSRAVIMWHNPAFSFISSHYSQLFPSYFIFVARSDSNCIFSPTSPCNFLRKCDFQRITFYHRHWLTEKHIRFLLFIIKQSTADVE